MTPTKTGVRLAAAGSLGALLLAGCAANSSHDVALVTSPTSIQPGPTIPDPSTPGSPAKTTAPASVGPAGTRSAPPALPLAGKVVVIDPGHNGGNADHAAQIAEQVPMGDGQTKECDTTGTQAPDGYTEHAFNFDVSQQVAALLQAEGAKVILTRPNDTGVGPCVNVRAAIGNNADADAAISIHADGHDGGEGFHVIQAESPDGGSALRAADQKLATAVHDKYLGEAGFVPSTYLGVDGYDNRTDLAGLNLSTRPKVLIECGNMLSADDDSRLESAAGRTRIAKAIADGLTAYLLER